MKKLATIFTAAVMLFSSFAFAADSDNVNARIKKAFLSDFSSASAVNWEKISDFYFASFTVNGTEVSAAYNEEGELVGTSRPMESSQLPVSISMAINKKYEGYTVSKKALELSYQDETHYYLTVTNDTQALKLKCSIDGTLVVESKMKRK